MREAAFDLAACMWEGWRNLVNGKVDTLLGRPYDPCVLPAGRNDSQTRTGADLSTWQRYARAVGLAVLAGVTIYGTRELLQSDWRSVASFWSAHLLILLPVVGLGCADLFLEGLAWIWVNERFGLRAMDRTGARVFLAASAGKLMPAQLGRLIRPDAMVRLGRGSTAECLKAEGAVVAMDTVSVGALFVALVAYRVSPILAPVSVGVTFAAFLLLGDRVAVMLSGTKLGLPAGFWWDWRSFMTLLIQMAGWVAHGLAFYVLVSVLPGDVGPWKALFQAPAAAVLGVLTGLPGGIGTTEGLLGASLKLNGVPAEHLAIAVAAFRIATFWCWVPIGWLALLGLRKREPAYEASSPRVPEKGDTAAMSAVSRVE